MEICISAEKCGGCRYQGVPYTEQLKEKEEAVRKLLEAGGFDPSCVKPIKACPQEEHYRNKMDYTFGNEVIDGPLQLGMHERKRFMSVIYAGKCHIVPEDFNRILDAALAFCREKSYSFYHRKRHVGLLRYLILRAGVRTGEILVNIVTSEDSQEESFDEEGFVKCIMSTKTDGHICGIIHTIDYNHSDAVKPGDIRVLMGSDCYMERIMDLDFKVSAFSFFQTNVPAAERLYKDAIGLIDGIEGKTVYDLYCGTGTITQAMATKAGRVIGVEIVEEAVAAARDNAELNELSNCSFICGDVLTALDEIEELPDVIVVDPPRAGIHPKAMKKICSYGVKQIVYISCNPKTMVENLKTAEEEGYSFDWVQPYDNFPMTAHTETIVLLEKTTVPEARN